MNELHSLNVVVATFLVQSALAHRPSVVASTSRVCVIWMGKRPSGGSGSGAAAGKEQKLLNTDRNLVEIVGQAVRDNFSGWDSELLDLKQCDGNTLRQRFAADKQAYIESGGKSENIAAHITSRSRRCIAATQTPFRCCR